MKILSLLTCYLIVLFNSSAQPHFDVSVDSSVSMKFSKGEQNPSFPLITYYDYQIGEVPYGTTFTMDFYLKNLSSDPIEMTQMYWGEGFISPEWVDSIRVLRTGETGHFTYTYHSFAKPGNFNKAARVSIKYRDSLYHINIIFRGKQLEKPKTQKEIDGDIPTIQWDEPEGFNFGDVESGIPISHRFYFLNCGNKPIEIERVWFNGPRDWILGPIKSGETGWIEIHYNPSNEGAFHKQVAVYFFDYKETVYVNFSGHVIPSQNLNADQFDQIMFINSELPKIDWIDSTVFDFGDILTGPPVAHYFYFINREDHAIAISNILGGSEPIARGWKQGNIQPGDTGWVKMEFSPARPSPRFSKSIRVYFENYPGVQKLSIEGRNVQIKWLDSFADSNSSWIIYDCGIIPKQIFIHDFYFVNEGIDILSLNVQGGGGGAIWRVGSASVLPGDTSFIRCEYSPAGEGQFIKAGNVCLNTYDRKWQLMLKGFVSERRPDTSENKIVWLDSLYYDFGDVLVGEIVFHNFRFVNTSKETLSIHIMQTDGGSYWYADKYDNILPGDTCTITVEHRLYVSYGHPFRQEMRLLIRNYPALYKLRISGLTIDAIKKDE